MAQTTVVTGANAGIGKAIARQLAALGHHVVLVSRDASRGREAMEEIRAAVAHASIDLVVGDLATTASTHDLADRLLEQYSRIDVLINNAGVWMTRRQLNAEGVEMTFMVNHLAPFILCTRLLACLKDSAPARIVNVNSGLYSKGEANLEKLPTGIGFQAFKTYMHSKLCNALFSVELARRIEGTGVTVNALHPGVIRTGLGDSPGIIGMLLSFAKRFWGTPEAGAAPVVHLATSPDLEGISGKYFDVFKEVALDPKALDAAKAAELWELSARLTAR
ncbi:MAG: SDR family oxidoreductase [Candidatus Hydrogenedentes bacterium]|nr:SDR family oxidoreductase [Candidatus Hydrogenedentota bacterium]